MAKDLVTLSLKQNTDYMQGKICQPNLIEASKAAGLRKM